MYRLNQVSSKIHKNETEKLEESFSVCIIWSLICVMVYTKLNIACAVGLLVVYTKIG